MTLAVRALGIFAVLLVGCGPTTFVCEDRVQCVREQMQGRCEPTGRCSYRDDTCASGWRYGANAGDDFASLCVEPLPAASTGDGPASSSDTTTSGRATSGQTGSSSGSSETTGDAPTSTGGAETSST